MVLKNSQWLKRTRLVNKPFKLNGPWLNATHPAESGTIITLEQKLDGRIYLVGLTITGTYENN